ncbi:MAG TPA: ubiquitin-like small modifier protein 1 [Chloroflexota bacterium]|nr:ubiquitin-like small modifier protein 1 [Chloroflexota bacterium]
MAVQILIPSTLKTLTDNQTTISLETEGKLGEVLDALDQKFPGIGERLRDESGEIRRFVNIYVNGDDVRFLDGAATTLKAGDELSIVPAMAGGC